MRHPRTSSPLAHSSSNCETDITEHSRPPAAKPPNGILPGTVASRVQFLQSLQGAPKTRSPSPHSATSIASYRRENSRSSFGRRLTKRFAPPAVRGGQPIEDARFDTSHSFLGLHTPRNNHIEEHGWADSRARYSKSPGINGVLTPVPRERAQYDAVAPWAGLSQHTTTRGTGLNQDTNDKDGHRNDRLPHYGQDDRAIAEQLPRPHQDHSNRVQHDSRSVETDTWRSEQSYATTSSIRRQNVRQLFVDYGVERPVGLASSQGSRPVAEARPVSTRVHRYCHQCAWVNEGSSIKCWRCGHRLCSVCDTQSPQPASKREPSLSYYERRLRERQIDPKPAYPPARRIEIESVNQSPVRPGPTPLQTRRDEPATQVQKESSQIPKCPDVPVPPPNMHRYGASRPQNVTNQTNLNSKLSVSQLRASLRDSTAVVADAAARDHCIALFPSDKLVESADGQMTYSYHNHHHHKRQPLRKEEESSLSSHQNCCQRSSCQQSRCDHSSEQYFSSYVKESKRTVREDTETGYITDRSRVEDDPHDPSRSVTPPQVASTFSPPLPNESRKLQNAHQQCHRAKHSISQPGVPEYVECHGYPRTGHNHHGSCSGASLVGECQHDFEQDCQCAACQSTHHNVRCCTHRDHNAMVHQHHTPRKTSLVDFGVKPLSISRKPSLLSQTLPTSRKTSPPPQNIAAIPPRAQSVDEQPRFQRQARSPRKGLVAKTSLEKLSAMSLTKRSVFLREATKPISPPPWVSTPISELLKPVRPGTNEKANNRVARDVYVPLRKRASAYSYRHLDRSSRDVKDEPNEHVQEYTPIENILVRRNTAPKPTRPSPLDKVDSKVDREPNFPKRRSVASSIKSRDFSCKNTYSTDVKSKQSENIQTYDYGQHVPVPRPPIVIPIAPASRDKDEYQGRQDEDSLARKRPFTSARQDWRQFANNVEGKQSEREHATKKPNTLSRTSSFIQSTQGLTELERDLKSRQPEQDVPARSPSPRKRSFMSHKQSWARPEETTQDTKRFSRERSSMPSTTRWTRTRQDEKSTQTEKLPKPSNAPPRKRSPTSPSQHWASFGRNMDRKQSEHNTQEPDFLPKDRTIMFANQDWKRKGEHSSKQSEQARTYEYTKSYEYVRGYRQQSPMTSRKNSEATEKSDASLRSNLVRRRSFAPDSRPASRKPSNLYLVPELDTIRSEEPTPVPQQEDEMSCGIKSQYRQRDGVSQDEPPAIVLQSDTERRDTKPDGQTSEVASSTSSTDSRKRLRLKVVDKRSSQSYMTNQRSSAHRLSEDRIESTGISIVSGHRLSADVIEDTGVVEHIEHGLEDGRIEDTGLVEHLEHRLEDDGIEDTVLVEHIEHGLEDDRIEDTGLTIPSQHSLYDDGAEGARFPDEHSLTDDLLERTTSSPEHEMASLEGRTKRSSYPMWERYTQVEEEPDLEDRIEEIIPRRKIRSHHDTLVALHHKHGRNRDCTWKKMFFEVQCIPKDRADLGISGVTVVLHFEERSDLVLSSLRNSDAGRVCEDGELCEDDGVESAGQDGDGGDVEEDEEVCGAQGVMGGL